MKLSRKCAQFGLHVRKFPGNKSGMKKVSLHRGEGAPGEGSSVSCIAGDPGTPTEVCPDVMTVDGLQGLRVTSDFFHEVLGTSTQDILCVVIWGIYLIHQLYTFAVHIYITKF